MNNIYDPTLRARREALEVLQEDLTVEEYEIAEKAVDLFLDKFDEIMEHSKEVTIHAETGRLTITSDDYDSQS